jgi:vacuolar protein sorting-associated protein 13A/C
LKTRIAARLNKGTFALQSDSHGEATEIISVVFDQFKADVVQRTDNFEAEMSLGDFSVFDGTTPNTLYPQIVQVKRSARSREGTTDGNSVAPLTKGDPFFYIKFEHEPLDERADSAVTLRMKHMEIIYHKGYVEAIHKFFKPPSSQLESVEALLVCFLRSFHQRS